MALMDSDSRKKASGTGTIELKMGSGCATANSLRSTQASSIRSRDDFGESSSFLDELMGVP